MFSWLRNRSPSEGKVVETSCGSIVGIVSKSRDGHKFNEWRGIPYGKPPVGPLRFASPQPYGKWVGTRDGSKFGSSCPELMPFGVITGNEDCLFLNVAAPEVLTTELLPVMVFIHGGAFQNGCGNDWGPDFFMDENVIIVTPNYRLGAFGFLNTGDTVIRGNMGLKDQALALRWVKDNIQYFGGNPNLITIFGESAGAASVHHLMLSPSTKGLFNKVISQSGDATVHWAIESTENAVKYTHKYAERLNCPTDDSTKLADSLRSKSIKELLFAHKDEMGELLVAYMETHHFRPSIEAVNDKEAFLVEHPVDILSQGKAQRVPWMTGVNADEGLLFSMLFYNSEKEMDVFEKVWENATLFVFGIPRDTPNAKQVAASIREIYFPQGKILTKEEKLEQYTKMFGDACYYLSVNHSISLQKQFSLVYPYFFSRRGGPSLSALMNLVSGRAHVAVKLLKYMATNLCHKVTGNKPKDYGVCHADDLGMLFKCTKIKGFNVRKDPNSADYKFSKEMVKLWVDFATDETSMTFRGLNFPVQEANKDNQYFEICESPTITPGPFAERIHALNKLGLIELSMGKGNP